MKIGTFWGAVFAAGATLADYFVVREGCHALSLSGAAQAMADFDFYVTLLVFGPVGVIVGGIGFFISNFLGEFDRNPLVTVWLAISALAPVIMYFIFRWLW